MRYRKQSGDGDYVFGGSANDFLKDTDAVAQAIKTNLLLLKGEWWENTEKGLPLFQNILGRGGAPQNVQAADLLVRDVILGTPGVRGIKDFKSTYEGRTYSLRCTAETQYGDIDVGEVNLF